MPHPERVCVTGCGVVSPLGNRLDEFWRCILNDPAPAGPVRGFDASRYRVDLAHQVESGWGTESARRASAFALTAARAAIGTDTLGTAPDRVALSLGTTAGGWEAGQRLARSHSAGGRVDVAEFLGRRGENTRDAPVRAVARELGLSGPVAVHSAACAASAYAITWGVERIRAGQADIVLAGGVDTVTELAYAGFHSVRALAPDACRPFSKGRRGIVLGEGAAILALESESSALRRGAPIIAELLGYGLATDTRDMTNPSAATVEKTMAAALTDAGCRPEELDSISAHGTGTQSNDLAEAQAIAGLLGGDVERVPVCAIKSAIGHTQGAASAFGCVAATMTVATGSRPPLRNYLGADADLPQLRFARGGGVPVGATGGPVLVNAFGFGGATSSVVIGPGNPGRRARGAGRRPRAARRPVFISGARGLLGDAAGGIRPFGDGRLTVEPAPESGERSPLGLVSTAMGSLLGCGTDGGGECGAYLGTFHGSQAIHEHASVALAQVGPTGYRPRDFAVSTYNAPVGAGAIELGLRGPTSTLLGLNSGLGAIGAAAEVVASGRCERMIAGGYDSPTPLLTEAMRQALGLEVDAAAAMVMLDADPEHGLAEVLAWGSLATVGAWPTNAELGELCERLIPAGEPSVDAIVVDSKATAAWLDSSILGDIPALRSAAMLTPAARFGPHRLAAAGPLAVLLALGAFATEAAPGQPLLDCQPSLGPGATVAVLAPDTMTGLDLLLLKLP